jgi:hypothetical protein
MESHCTVFLLFGRYSSHVGIFYGMCEVQVIKSVTAWLTKWRCREDSHVTKDPRPYSDPDEQEMVSNPTHWAAMLSDCCYDASIHDHLEPLHQIVQADLPLQYIFKLFEHCKDCYCHSWRENKFNFEI